MKRYPLMLLTLLLGQAWALPSFRASYDVKVRGIHAGQMTMDAVLTSQSYTINAKTEPSLPAKMLGYGFVNEIASGEIHNNHLRPRKYERTMEDNEKYHLNYNFDLKARTIDATVGGKKVQLDYKDQVPLDTTALVIQALMDDELGKKASSYTMVSEDKVRSYKVEQLKDQLWQDEKGKSIPVRVYRQTNGNRQTMVYIADNPRRLVKLQQIKNDQNMFLLKLVKYKPL